MFPVVHVGPLAVQAPGLLLLAGLWLGISLAEKNAGRYALQGNLVDNLVLVSLLAGLVGARLGYVARFPNAFLPNLASLFSLNPGLLDPSGGLLAGALAALVYGSRKRLPFWSTLDALTPGLALFSVFLGLAHLASGDAFGAPTHLPWGIYLWGEVRQPSQVYEILAAGIILWVVWPQGRLSNPPAQIALTSGRAFLTFLALSAAARIFLEAFRGDSVLVFDRLRLAQLIAWGVLAVALWGLGKRLPREGKAYLQEDRAKTHE